LIICGVLFWPTLYRYDKTQSKLVRINRITGYTEVLTESSWEPVAKKEPFNLNDYVPLQAIPKEEIAKIEIMGDFDGERHYNFRLYNGAKWSIKSLKLILGLKDGNNKKFWQRIYEITADVQPFSIVSSSIELMDYAPKTLTSIDENVLLKAAGFKNNDEYVSWAKSHPQSPINKSEERLPEVRIEAAFGYRVK
jgi:hypothetical protein